MLFRSVRRLLPNEIGFTVSVHDVGKVSPGYELKYFSDTVVRQHVPELLGCTSFSSLHATIGAAAIDHWLGTHPLQSPVALAAAAHHGTLDRSYPQGNAETLGGPAWAEERRKQIEHLSSVFGGSLQNAVNANPWLLAGLTCVADWIGSDERFFPADRPPVIGGDPAKTAQYAITECGFRPVSIRKGLSFSDVFNFQPRNAQLQFIERVSRPGLYVLEAPMGIGKTEAALYATYRLMEVGYHHGFYFALPTRLTSDRIHERVSQFLSTVTDSQTPPKLAHGMAWLHDCPWKYDDDEGRERHLVHSWFNPMKRALLYPFAVGTIDQALLSVLNVKHSFVRLFGLAGKVVILDEVHSYDMYTGTLLDELVNRLQQIGCTVIILSATLTGARRNRLAPAMSAVAATDDYPLMTGLPSDGPHLGDPFALRLTGPAPKKARVRMEPWDNAAVANQAVAAAREGRCIVCIANTVAKAQSWYRTVKSSMSEDAFPVGILHARFPMFRREAIENEWMGALGKNSDARPRGCILIATQIVEQSVDIDADWMISELAPTDMLLQRMGRLWRHDRKERTCSVTELVIVAQDPTACSTPEDVALTLGKENCCVYAPYVLKRTFDVWNPLRAVVLPGDIRGLIEATYADRDEPSESVMGQLKRKLEERCEHLRRLACSAKDTNLGFPTGKDDENAATRFSDLPTRAILLLDGRPEIGRAHV